MSELDVNSDTLRAAGEDLNEWRGGDMAERSTVSLLHGSGDNTSLSTGGFFPGVLAQSHLRPHPQRAYEFFVNLDRDLLGLASALYVVAEIYDHADHLQAMEFAFVNPDVGIPAGLPPDISQDNTLKGSQEEGEEMPVDGAVGSIELEDGQEIRESWVRDPDNGPGWTRVVQVYDGDTLVRTEHYYRDPTTGNYANSMYNGDGEFVRSDHKVVYSNGTTYYYTQIPGEDGNEQVNGQWFNPQTGAVDHGETLDWQAKEGIELTEAELRQHGFDPDEG